MRLKPIVKHVVCADGATVSVQASEHHYCSPRDNAGPYTHVEAGFPTVPPPDSWREYMDGDGDPCQQVYGYVPIAVIAEFIEAHGGMVGGELPVGVRLPERVK